MTACLRALSQPQQQQRRRRQSPGADDVLEQVLYHDLRDVVRTFATDNTNHTANSNSTTNALTEETLPSAQLRQAIQQSQQGGTHGFRGALPPSFALMVQIEEVLDVSANAMSRLENGSLASNNNTGNHRPPSAKRCLKIAYTDGYNPPSGDAVYREDDLTPHESLVAVEVQVIPDLNVTSPAGLKVLLHGPMEIRRGVAFWHPGNVTVLGGQVSALVARQRQALELAQRAAGVGVDPTVRALIGTTSSTPEEENDEGEHESGDVIAGRTVPLAPPPAANPPPISYPPPTALTPTGPIHTTATSATTNVSHTENPYQVQRFTSQPVAATPPPAPTGNPYNRTASRSTPPTMVANARQPSSSSTNSSWSSHASRHISGSNSNSCETTRTHTNRSPVNPYTRAGTTTSQRKPTVPLSTNTRVSGLLPADEQVILIDEDNSTPMKEEVVMVEDDVAMKESNDCHTTTAYHDFYKTLHSLVEGGPDLFGKAIQQEWLVELKQMISTRVDFNVISRKQLGSKRKVYEYWLLYKFGDPENCDHLVTCRLDTLIVEESFGYSAADLRKLRKMQSSEAQRISKEGGQRIAARIAKRQLYRVTLIDDIPATFWQETPRRLDGKQPILYLREH
jgi:hypothetical protein